MNDIIDSGAESTGPSPDPELLTLIPQLNLWPGENLADFENLRAALLADLAPGTPYEVALAENLVESEWQAMRHRQLRDTLLMTAFREFAIGAFQTGKIGRVFASDQDPRCREYAFALADRTSDHHRTAIGVLGANGITIPDLVAAAYADAGPEIDLHDRRLAEIEVRRRRLYDDYLRLRDRRRRRVEEAIVVDAP